MKKYLLVYAFIVPMTIQSFSQSSVVLPTSVYNDLKTKGELKPGIKYFPIDQEIPKQTEVTEIKVTQEHLNQMNYNAPTATNCSCLVPLDGTFNIAEFTSTFVTISPPNYRNDDGSTLAKALPFNFCFYGTTYSSVFINNNGNISFVNDLNAYSASGFPAGPANNPGTGDDTIMVAPFWADVDTRAPASGLVYYKITPTYMIVKWEAVGYYNSKANKKNTFQLIISDGTDPIIPNGNNVAFCYGDMQWTTGDIDGTNGFGGTPANAGINRGDGISYFQLGRFNLNNSNYDGPYNNNDGINYLDNKSFYFSTCAPGNNIPPVLSPYISICDSFKICGTTDTLVYSLAFSSPETGQTVNSITASAPTLGSAFTVLNTTLGQTGTILFRIIASPGLVGNHTITITATDDGTPSASSVIAYNVPIQVAGAPPIPDILMSPPNICPGFNSTFSLVNPGVYDSYSWSNGVTGGPITVADSNVYYVTVNKNGCYKTTLDSLTISTTVKPVILGKQTVCGTQQPTTNLYVSNPSFFNGYTWTGGSTNDSLLNIGVGTYIVNASNSGNNCITKDTAIVSNIFVPVTISGQTDFCPGANSILTASSGPPFTAFNWQPSGDNTASTIVTAAGTYTVNATIAPGCIATATALVNLYDQPNANFSTSPDGTTDPSTIIQFTDLSTVNSGLIMNWYWNFGDGATSNLPNPTHQYLIDGTFPVTFAVQSNNGCWDTIRINYTIVSELGVPNVFTPNGDGKNDFLEFKNIEHFPNTSLSVFNRWGNKVYNSADYHNDWGGGGHADGTYFYILQGPALKESKKGYIQIFNK